MYDYLAESEKQRVKEIDTTINGLEQDVDVLKKYIRKTERVWTQMETKLKKERLVALTALAKSKILLAQMELLIAENELNNGPRNFELIPVEDELNLTATSFHHSNRSSSTTRSPTRSSPISSHSFREGSLSFTKSTIRSRSPSRQDRSTTKSRRVSSKSSDRGNNTSKSNKNISDRSIRSISSTPSSKSNNKPANNSTQEGVTKNKQMKLSLTSAISPKERNLESNIKEKSTYHKSSTSDMPLDNSSLTNNSSIHKSLTESIIAEFEKPYTKVIDLPKTSNTISISPPPESNTFDNTNARKKHKIKPVSNVAAYKKLKQNNSLNETPSAAGANVRPPLHPRDPRGYPTSNSREHSITGTPVAQTKPCRQVPTRQLNVPTPNKLVRIAPASASTEPSGPSHMPILTSLDSHFANTITQLPIQAALAPAKTGTEQNPGHTPLSDFVNNYPYIPSSHQSFANQVQVPSHPRNPEKENANDTSQLLIGNRHISVPPSPMYVHRRHAQAFDQAKTSNLNGHNAEFKSTHPSTYVPKEKLGTNTTDNCSFNFRPRICFYNSS